MTQERISWIDTLRGLAMITMVWANAAPKFFAAPHPFTFRLIGTWAAPLFIALAGMLVAKSDKPWNYHFKRGLLVLLTGAAIDTILFKHMPFTSVDVLYLTGVSIPLIALARQLPRKQQLVGAFIIFALAPWLRSLFGYADYPIELTLHGAFTQQAAHPTSIPNAWFLDGWFPLFPWFGFAWAGALAWQFFGANRATKLLKISAVLLILGVWMFYLYPGPRYVRGGYSELFYPATTGYCLIALGILGTLRALAPNLKLLATFGQCSMFVYVAHLILIEVIPMENPGTLTQFIAYYALIMLMLVAAVLILQALKARWPKRPWWIRVYIG